MCPPQPLTPPTPAPTTPAPTPQGTCPSCPWCWSTARRASARAGPPMCPTSTPGRSRRTSRWLGGPQGAGTLGGGGCREGCWQVEGLWAARSAAAQGGLQWPRWGGGVGGSTLWACAAHALTNITTPALAPASACCAASRWSRWRRGTAASGAPWRRCPPRQAARATTWPASSPRCVWEGGGLARWGGGDAARGERSASPQGAAGAKQGRPHFTPFPTPTPTPTPTPPPPHPHPRPATTTLTSPSCPSASGPRCAARAGSGPPPARRPVARLSAPPSTSTPFPTTHPPTHPPPPHPTPTPPHPTPPPPSPPPPAPQPPLPTQDYKEFLETLLKGDGSRAPKDDDAKKAKGGFGQRAGAGGSTPPRGRAGACVLARYCPAAGLRAWRCPRHTLIHIRDRRRRGRGRRRAAAGGLQGAPHRHHGGGGAEQAVGAAGRLDWVQGL
jgi:hypothetical protein